jgi:hypothetical protein
MNCPICDKRLQMQGGQFLINSEPVTHGFCKEHGTIRFHLKGKNMHQSSIPCPACGSWYRTSERAESAPCNKCGTVITEPPEPELTMHRENKGRQWSKKLHRYLTQKELSQGKKGG